MAGDVKNKNKNKNIFIITIKVKLQCGVHSKIDKHKITQVRNVAVSVKT